MDIKETNIYAQYKQTLYSDASLDLVESDAPIMFAALVGAMTKFLGNVKSTEVPSVALTYRDDKGNFKMGGIVEYHKNEEDPTMPGNFTYELSFYEDDITRAEKVYEHNDLLFQTCMSTFIETEFKARLTSSFVLMQMIPIALNTLINWLDENAKDKETVLDVKPYFTCSSIIEKGTKIFSITPSSEMKTLIKDDSMLQA